MNKDQLLDAIGMVDEQKIHDAAMIKRTKWLSGIITALVVLFMLALPTIVAIRIAFALDQAVYDYSLYHLAQDIDNANVVTVYPDYAISQSRYTIHVPDGIRTAMRFDKWTPAAEQEIVEHDILLTLHFSDTWLQFYNGGYVRAEKHDWDTYIGIYTVPEDLWQELTVFLAK